MRKMHWTVSFPSRLLSFLREKEKHYTTKELRWAIEHNRCWVNGHIETFASTSLKTGDTVSIWPLHPPRFSFSPESVLYEDPYILAYDKPPFFCSESIAQNLGLHLVHRLDRDTTGVLLCAKNTEACQALALLFRKRHMHKEYRALVKGVPPQNAGKIQGPMVPLARRQGAVIWTMASAHSVSAAHGLFSSTSWKRLAYRGDYALLACFPFTGRTHQIRVHLRHIGCPLVGDAVYGSKKGEAAVFRPLLHATQLHFSHPFTQQPLQLQSPFPEDFQRAILSRDLPIL